MHIKNDHKKKQSKIGVFFILVGFFLIFFQYFFVYTINENDINQYMSQRISNVIEDVDIKIDVIDQLRTEYGLVVLFQTNVEEKPIGYAVFEKDAIFNRYVNEDFALYNNRITHNLDTDVLVDLNCGYVFQFVDDKIVVVNTQPMNKPLIKYYILIVIAILAIAYGFVIRRRKRGIISKHDEKG